MYFTVTGSFLSVSWVFGDTLNFINISILLLIARNVDCVTTKRLFRGSRDAALRYFVNKNLGGIEKNL